MCLWYSRKYLDTLTIVKRELCKDKNIHTYTLNICDKMTPMNINKKIKCQYSINLSITVFYKFFCTDVSHCLAGFSPARYQQPGVLYIYTLFIIINNQHFYLHKYLPDEGKNAMGKCKNSFII